jgi:predicted ATPase/DNA-binding SARP family transcriptional activator
MSTLQLFLLGPPRVELARQAVDIPRRKAQALLFFLAVTGVPQRRATLATLLWPDHDQQRAHGSLRRHLSELNLLLGPDCFAGDRERVWLAPTASLWLDVAAFHQAVAHCQTHGHPARAVCNACLAPLTQATTLYGDDFLTGFSLPDCPAFDEWQFFQTETLRQTLATALERLVHLHMEQNEPETALAYAQRRLRLDPLHEPAHRQLMHLYVATGQMAAALRQYDLCVQTLREELDAAPEAETIALYEQIRRSRGREARGKERGAPGMGSPTRPGLALPHNLPAQTTPFIGRQPELNEVARLCNRPGTRLVTILGPGGIGKTRLALEVAHALVASTAQPSASGEPPCISSALPFADGVYFVALAPLKAAAHIVPTIAEAIHFQFQADGRLPQQQLLDYLAEKQLLLVLDNVEHLLDSVELIDALLQAAPQVRILATSRERLRLTSETVFTLDSMAFPTWETPQEALAYSAIQLFVETAQRVRPAFTVDATNVQYVARICRLVGGMPLGIILAAAWMGVLSSQEIAAELTQGFDLLAVEFHDLPPRQRSMRAVLTYSWQRLTPAERVALMRLAVFQGGFTRAAVEAVAGAPLHTLVQLVDKSFVQRTSHERYEIHELLRQYAEEQLHASGQMQLVQAAHCTYYLAFVAQREAALAGEQQVAALAELSADFENIRAAWHWAVQQHHYPAIERALEGVFRWFWIVRSHQHAGQALVRQAWEQWTPLPGQAPPPVWARLMARLMEQQGPWLTEAAMTRQRIEHALASARQQGDRAEIAFCCWALGLAIVSEAVTEPSAPIEPTLRRAACFCIQSLRQYRTLENRFYRAQVLETLGHCYRRMRRLERAMVHLQASLELRREAGDRFGMARSVRELGFAAYGLGLGPETEAAWQQAYEMQQALGDQQGIADSIFFLSVLALTREDWQTAKALAAQTLAIAVTMNNAFYRKWADRALEIVTCMEQTMPAMRSDAAAAQGFTTSRAALFHMLFSPPVASQGYQHALHKALALAVTETDKAICLPFVAFTLVAQGELHQAVMLLSLAFRYPDIGAGWVSRLPEIVELKQTLQTGLSPIAFRRAWEQGQQLELSATIASFRSTASV